MNQQHQLLLSKLLQLHQHPLSQLLQLSQQPLNQQLLLLTQQPLQQQLKKRSKFNSLVKAIENKKAPDENPGLFCWASFLQK
ncbi:MAG: hypothetical protein LW710_02840 [Burkholderiales bacterium]|nr:hypothetical protein [Burkholderiales bacterium]